MVALVGVGGLDAGKGQVVLKGRVQHKHGAGAQDEQADDHADQAEHIFFVHGKTSFFRS